MSKIKVSTTQESWIDCQMAERSQLSAWIPMLFIWIKKYLVKYGLSQQLLHHFSWLFDVHIFSYTLPDWISIESKQQQQIKQLTNAKDLRNTSILICIIAFYTMCLSHMARLLQNVIFTLPPRWFPRSPLSPPPTPECPPWEDWAARGAWSSSWRFS